MSRVTHMNQSRHTSKWVISQIWIIHTYLLLASSTSSSKKFRLRILSDYNVYYYRLMISSMRTCRAYAALLNSNASNTSSSHTITRTCCEHAGLAAHIYIHILYIHYDFSSYWIRFVKMTCCYRANLKCVAVCCSVLQCVALWYSVLQYVAE